MSAIFGAYLRDGRPLEPACLRLMSERLAHRGPETGGLWCSGSAGLGHRILRTTSESLAEGAPIIRGDGDLVLVADARIDNRDELIAELDPRQALPRGISDGHLILLAYQRWQRETPERLIGDFAFAVWDARRRTLFCARDPMGVKPLYYYVSGRLCAFASEIKGLFCLPEVPRHVDEVQVAFYLDSFVADRSRTFYRDILRLPAAHSLEVDPERARARQYWAPNPNREIRYSTNDQYSEAFREVFTQAVECRLRSASPVGCALSGGLDSSSIVGSARRLLQEDLPLPTFSAVFPDLPGPERERNDESQYIDAVVEQGGIISHRIRADRIGPLTDLDRIIRYHDAPPLGYNVYVHCALYSAARNEGVRVFLDGMDGDSIVGYGYGRLLDLARERCWDTLASEIAALSQRYQGTPSFFLKRYIYPHLVHLARSGRWRSWLQASGEIARRFDHPMPKLIARYGVGAFIPPRVTVQWHKWRGEGHEGRFLRPQFVRRVGLEERKRDYEPNRLEANLPSRLMHALSLPSPLLQRLLELADSVAAAFSTEPRYPFLDRRLVEFCVALPVDQKLADGWTRLIQRRAMEGILPPLVQWRVRKGDLSYNYVRALREIHRVELESTLFDEPVPIDEYVDMASLRSIHKRFLSEDDSKGSEQDPMILFRAAVLARWLRGSPLATSPST